MKAFSRDTYASGPRDRNDCSIRSFATAACIGYEEAFELFKKHGRRAGRGTPQGVTKRLLAEQFPEAKEINPGVTTTRFAKTFNEGHYVVHVRGHALAVVDGVVHDWRPRPRARVHSAWRLA